MTTGRINQVTTIRIAPAQSTGATYPVLVPESTFHGWRSLQGEQKFAFQYDNPQQHSLSFRLSDSRTREAMCHCRITLFPDLTSFRYSSLCCVSNKDHDLQ